MALVSKTPRSWTREEYYRLGESGVIPATERVELIKGEIVSMSPQDPLHSGAIDNLNKLFNLRLGDEFTVRVQLPVSLSGHSEPEPDLCLVKNEIARISRRNKKHPGEASLVVEVANSSLAYDRLEKLSLYAEAGFPEYWIANVVDWVVEVHQRPIRDSSKPYGWAYGERLVFGMGQEVIFQGRTMAVDAIFADLVD